MSKYHFAMVALCLAMSVCLQGCGKEAAPPIFPTEGIVLLNGSPLPNAQVRFIPQIDQGPQYIATGVTDDQGRFSLKCNGQPGACASENIVIVSEADIPANLLSEDKQRELAVYRRALKNRPIPQNYASPVNTPLRVTPSEGQSEHKLELKR